MSELEWNVRAPEQPGGIDLLRLSVRSFRGDVRQATPADLIAALKANAAACGEVMAAMGWVTDQALAVTGERAEQAERSLATVTAERDAAKYWLAAHKAASEALVEPVLAPDECSVAPYCLEDVTEERDALKRERDEARATNRDNLAMWEVERDALKAKLAEAERENLTLRNRIGIDRTSWHEAEAEVKVLRAKLAKTARERDDAMTLAEERRDYARAQNAKLSVECDDLRAQLTAVERERDEAHAALRDCATRLGNGSAVSPKSSHAFHCAVATEVGIVVPALRARLAESTEWGSRACEVLGYVLGTLNLCDEQHWAFDPLNVEPVKDKAVAVRLLVRDLRAQLAKTEAVVDAAREDAQHCPHACSPPCPFDRAVARTRAALRALDEDSGGSGAANPGEAASAIAAPEPAGSSQPTHVKCNGCGELLAIVGFVTHTCPDPEALRARLAKTERARERLTDGLKSAAGLDHTGPGSASFSRIFPEDTYPTNEKEADAFVKARMRLWFTTWIVTPMQDALRALDSPVGAGTDSGGASGAPAGPMGSYRGGRNPEAQGSADGTDPGGAHVQAPVTPAEPAGSCPCDCRLCASGHHVVCSRCLGRYADSPVGVATTACDHKRQRCENDHAVCRDCGAVNRAVTGVVDWGPPETDRDDGSSGAVADDQPASARLEKRADGWHYHDAEYPDEGYVGPFSLAIAAIAHAEGGGYLVDGADEHAPVTRAEVEELRWRVERLETLTGFVPKE